MLEKKYLRILKVFFAEKVCVIVSNVCNAQISEDLAVCNASHHRPVFQ